MALLYQLSYLGETHGCVSPESTLFLPSFQPISPLANGVQDAIVANMFGISFGPQSVSVNDAYERIGTDGHCLLDVRTEDEVRATAFPGALNIPLDRLETQVERLAPYTSIHVICRSGGRSMGATSLLHNLGLTHAENVAGGLMAWQAAGLPTD